MGLYAYAIKHSKNLTYTIFKGFGRSSRIRIGTRSLSTDFLTTLSYIFSKPIYKIVVVWTMFLPYHF